MLATNTMRQKRRLFNSKTVKVFSFMYGQLDLPLERFSLVIRISDKTKVPLELARCRNTLIIKKIEASDYEESFTLAMRIESAYSKASIP